MSSPLDTTFPELPEGSVPRKLYFKALAPARAKALRERGYDPVVLVTLPRQTPQDDQAYLKALGMGLLDGTIEMEKDLAPVLRLLFTEAGLVDKGARGASQGPSKPQTGSVKDLLSWGTSRHTIDQSTIQTGKQRKRRLKRGGQSQPDLLEK